MWASFLFIHSCLQSSSAANLGSILRSETKTIGAEGVTTKIRDESSVADRLDSWVLDSKGGILHEPAKHNFSQSVRKRRGTLQPPAPRLDKHADQIAMLALQGHFNYSTANIETQKQQENSEASQEWTFRGPKPFPLMEDPRLTNQEKEQELERLMEKLHYEFFVKKRMGHSRLAQARASFYKAVTDYQKLTGRAHPPHFNFEDLPEVPNQADDLNKNYADSNIELNGKYTDNVKRPGGARHRGLKKKSLTIYNQYNHHLHMDDREGGTEYNDSAPEVPSTMTSSACMSVFSESCPSEYNCCANSGPHCYANAALWSTSEACQCLQSWQKCYSEHCNATTDLLDPTTLVIIESINKREFELCQEGSSTLDHLHIEELEFLPDGTIQDDDEEHEDPRTQSLLEDEDGPIQLLPLLETRDNETLAGMDRRRKKPGWSNYPTKSCKVSNPEMLGDGNCDGGSYNTKECNWDGGDCCDADCRPSFHACGEKGYQCAGTREGVRVSKKFPCDKGKMSKFKDYFDKKRDELTLGKAMLSAKCTQLTPEEHNNVAQAFNLGIELSFSKKTKSAAAAFGGPKIMLDCKLWDEQMGNDWFGTLVTHEIGHLAGYSHPKFKKMVYKSKCRPLGSKYCPGHCKEWTSACENHLIFGSNGCGTANTACSTTCVRQEYCYSLPERITECFGYQKVHSRGESTKEIMGAYLTTIETQTGIPGAMVLFCLSGCCCSTCVVGCWAQYKARQKRAAAAGQGAQGEYHNWQQPTGEQPTWQQPTWQQQEQPTEEWGAEYEEAPAEEERMDATLSAAFARSNVQ